MDFTLPPHLQELRVRVRAFVEENVLPNERAIVAEDRRRQYDTLHSLQRKAREAGLWVPHLPKELGGQGLGAMGMCVLFREMGRSPVGARVFHCDAPDQGNMSLLLESASESIKKRWLEPLVAGEITSGFCMTEPAPGAGADPSNLKTTATPDGDGYRIDGHKWYTTGGADASFLIVMARTGPASDKNGASMFVVDRHAEGVEHVREIPVMAEPLLAHREAELKFHGVRVTKDDVLAEIGDGFRLAQRRLVPARLTHCMRWLGWADRTMDLCRDYLTTRVSFGRKLSEHQMIQQKLSENARGIHAGNLMTFHCASLLERAALEQGLAKEARAYSSMCKNHVAKLICQVLDDAIQMHGGLGYSDDMPFAQWYRMARAARLADGPDEVHDVVVAREWLLGRVNLLV